MPQIRPATDLRNTNEISELCNASSEPIFITKNGSGDMVIMSSEVYEQELALVVVYRKLLIAQKQLDSGVVADGDEVFRKMRDKYNYGV